LRDISAGSINETLPVLFLFYSAGFIAGRHSGGKGDAKLLIRSRAIGADVISRFPDKPSKRHKYRAIVAAQFTTFAMRISPRARNERSAATQSRRRLRERRTIVGEADFEPPFAHDASVFSCDPALHFPFALPRACMQHLSPVFSQNVAGSSAAANSGPFAPANA